MGLARGDGMEDGVAVQQPETRIRGQSPGRATDRSSHIAGAHQLNSSFSHLYPERTTHAFIVATWDQPGSRRHVGGEQQECFRREADSTRRRWPLRRCKGTPVPEDFVFQSSDVRPRLHI